ncbi:hypothetical protein BH23ACT2_BH23ACT2_14170 [soil metagenome]
MAEAGDIDALVNNAGINQSGPLESYDVATAQRCFETNVIGPLRMINALVPAMRERRSGVGGGPRAGLHPSWWAGRSPEPSPIPRRPFGSR